MVKPPMHPLSLLRNLAIVTKTSKLASTKSTGMTRIRPSPPTPLRHPRSASRENGTERRMKRMDWSMKAMVSLSNSEFLARPGADRHRRHQASSTRADIVLMLDCRPIASLRAFEADKVVVVQLLHPTYPPTTPHPYVLNHSTL